MEIETVNKSKRETTLEIENLGKRLGVIDANITNTTQVIAERISGIEDTIENIDTAFQENAKCKNILSKNIQEIQDTMRRSNPRIVGIDENGDFST
jgi:methyl-accepting chemotaxis protein